MSRPRAKSKPKAKSRSKSTWITKAQTQNIAKNSNSTVVAAAFSKLGPINNYTDLLDSITPVDHAVCLASEQVIHMAESWRYLSSAMHTYLNHEAGNATHLAYYAELRAVLSLYAGSGIRVKLKDAYWIDQAANIQPIPDHATHTLVWDIWQDWISRSDAKTLLDDNIRLEAGVTLGHFQSSLNQFSPNILLSQWGYDLLNLKDDHRARNRASYLAYWRDASLTKMTNGHLDFVKTLSTLFLTAGPGLAFDQALIQYAVHETISGFLDPQAPETHAEVKVAKLDEIATFVAGQSGANKSTILQRLSSNMGQSIFDAAAEKKDDVENVISRAAFLARLAMLFVKKNITVAGDNNAKAWLFNWLEHCGTWDPSAKVDVADIQTDYEDALREFSKGSTLLPKDLWKPDSAFSTNQVANMHACIAWGALA